VTVSPSGQDWSSAEPAALRRKLDGARAIVTPHVHRTPLVRSRRISEMLGRPVLLKLECLQKTGCFKVRGFLYNVQRVRREGLRRDGPHCEGVVDESLSGRTGTSAGVLTFSSGNAAQGLAYAAQQAGCPATVMMTPGVNPAKVAATREYGARIVFAESLETIAESAADLAAREGLALLHPYDDPALMIGHSSLGLELVEDIPPNSTVVTAVGGGGMAGALSLVAQACGHPFKLVSAEPLTAARLHSAMQAGRPVPCAGMSIAEGLCPPSIGHACFDLIRRTIVQHVLVSDDQIRDAMRTLLECAKVLAEPSGATALAAALSGAIRRADGPTEGGPLVVIVSGGNISAERLKELL
jgi:threonine dehydratase